MALRGSIDDVPIIDVLQFVHLSGKSGTLALTSPTGPAWVEFSQGNIVFATGPASKSLGETLVERGGLTKEQVAGAVEAQRKDPARPPLGNVLLQRRLISADRLADCVRHQIHEAMMDLASWRTGEFQLGASPVEALDGTRVQVAEVLPQLQLNTKFLLFEAVRLLDERERDRAQPSANGSSDPAGHARPVDAAASGDPIDSPFQPRNPPRLVMPEWKDVEPFWSAAFTKAEADGANGTSIRSDVAARMASAVLLAGFEKALSPAVTRSLASHGYKVLGHVPRRDIESMLLGDKHWPQSMVLLLRLRAEEAANDELDESLALVERITGRHPGWNLLALVSGALTKGTARAYAAGVHAVLPMDPADLSRDPAEREGLVAVVTRISKDAERAANAEAAELRAWLRAKRVTSEMLRALQGANIALELMRVAADTFERAALFLAKEGQLLGLGAFGSTAAGAPMAESLRGFGLTTLPDTPLSRALADKAAVTGPARSLGLGERFFDIAGRPASDQAVLVPLVGPSKAIGVLYGDNGTRELPLRSLHAVEIAAAHAGVAYENALLRGRLALPGGPVG